MQQYLDLMQRILAEGVKKADRTGTGTLSVFGHQMRFDLAQGFPLVTTKKLHVRSIIHELLWFLTGDTNIKYLQDNGVSIWNEWADANGDLGPVYGRQWRAWPGKDGTTIDQISKVLHSIKNNPDSRRHMVVAYNPTFVDEMALPPCHALFQFYVANGKLSCQLYQRSADTFLGVPFNIASYSLLTHLLAHHCGLIAHELVYVLGNAHIYQEHVAALELQVVREPFPFPSITIVGPPKDDINEYIPADFVLKGYTCHEAVKMTMKA